MLTVWEGSELEGWCYAIPLSVIFRTRVDYVDHVALLIVDPRIRKGFSSQKVQDRKGGGVDKGCMLSLERIQTGFADG
jgi:hypothetical protein